MNPRRFAAQNEAAGVNLSRSYKQISEKSAQCIAAGIIRTNKKQHKGEQLMSSFGLRKLCAY